MRKIVVWLERGVVYDVTGIPAGTIVEVRDYDEKGGSMDTQGEVYSSSFWVPGEDYGVSK